MDINYRGKYPHMLAEDQPVWDRFLEQYADLFLHFFYDTRVGGQINLDPAISPQIADMWYNTTAKRIDALGEREKEIWIIEVAQRPSLRAVGQILSYYSLWLLDPLIKKPIINVLVADTLDVDLQYVLFTSGIRYYLV